MKIRCHILCKNRNVEIKKADPSKEFFKFNKGLYLLSKDAVNLAVKGDGSPNTVPELFYIEDKPVPVNIIAEKKSPMFLDEIIITNALKSLQPRNPFEWLGSSIKEFVSSPAKIVSLLLSLVIVYAVLTQLLGGLL